MSTQFLPPDTTVLKHLILMIVNRTRAECRASVTKIPIRIEDIEKVPAISEEIKVMLRSNPKVILETDAPYCYISRLESSYGELTIGCNLQNMGRLWSSYWR